MQNQRDPQATFFDLAVAQRKVSNHVLETIAREVDFTEAEAQVATTYSVHGRPAARSELLLRVMILQHLYGLSDPQAEAQLNDRLSFQKFVQLAAGEAVPDESTIGRFRQRLIACGLHERLLQLVNQQLEAKGYMVKRATMVDATIVASSRRRPSPAAAAGGTAPDAQASYTFVRGRSFYGYKAHVSTDAEHQLIRAAVLTSANACEAHVFARITPEDTQAVYADKAYDTKANRLWLEQRGMANGILKKPARHIQLSAADRRANVKKGLVRRQIEKVFGQLKQWQQYRRVRYLGVIKNQLELTLKAVAYNLKRLAKLTAPQTT
jgi:IS5 family transposase